MLISFGGLPGVGKTTIARELARRQNALHLRIDTIEQALRDAGLNVVADEGYRVAYAIAEDNLKLGRIVISDCVNPLTVTRDAWRLAAEHAQAPFLEVEIVCSDLAAHQQRVETRASDIAGLTLPSWAEVLARERDPWTREHLVFDSARYRADEIVEMLDWPIERARKR